MINFPSQSSQPSVMRHDFSRVPSAQIQRSAFDRSHGYKTTFDAGYLVPCYWDYAYPGDTHSVNGSFLARLATPLKPVMDNMILETFFFAVPFRLILDTAAQLMGQIDAPQVDPYDPPVANTHVVPQIVSDGTINTNGDGSLADYFGIPTRDAASTAIVGLRYSALRFRAYHLIWNEWFRDQNMQAPVTVLKGEGDDATTFLLLRRGKRHDYFTSCLPWPQKSSPVTIPLAGQAPLVFPTLPSQVRYVSGGADGDIFAMNGAAGPAAPLYGNPNTPGGAPDGASIIMPADSYADMSLVTAMTLNQFFQAYAMQQFFMADARNGNRITEIIFGHFGVSSPDMRLQRPEFLGGGSTNVNVSPIPQTSVAAGTPQGNLAAMGLASGSGHGFTYSSTEWCVIIGLMCVRADLTYQQGLEREESVRTRTDFYWPAFANIGEQAVLSKEIYADASAADDDVFGYQEPWAHMRYKRSNITGQFRSVHPTPLDYWTLSQEFGSRPVLGNSFIVEDPPVDRVIAVPAEPHFLLDAYFRVNSVRPMPTYSVPGIVNHF